MGIRFITERGGDSAPSVAPATAQVSFLTDGLYTAASPSQPPVAGSFFAVVDTMSSLTTLYGNSLTTGAGITGLTEGSYCEITTASIIDNITSPITLYFELISAAPNSRNVIYGRDQVPLTKIDPESPGRVKFCFIVTADMVTDGVKVVIGGHRGSAGTLVHSFTHTVKEHF